MMREGWPPLLVRGSQQIPHRGRLAAAAAFVRALVATVAITLLLPVWTASAQDPSIVAPLPNASSFPKPQGGILGGPAQRIDRTKPLYLQDKCRPGFARHLA